MPSLDDLPPELRPLIEQFVADVTGFMLALQLGTLTTAQWRKVMAESLAKYHTAAMMVGMGSTELSPELMNLLENSVDVQVSFLDNFARVINASPEFNPAWVSRAQMYAESPKASWAEGDIVRQVGRPLPLPAMPGDGTTQCLTNCLCRWKITQTADNSFVAKWERHADDSCQTCVIRGQDWANLIIENGVLLP